MSKYQELYNGKKITIEEALSKISTGDTIVTSLCAMEPFSILSQLHTLHGKVEDIYVLNTLGLGKHEFLINPKYRDTFNVASMFFMGVSRESHKNKITSPIPTHLHNLAVRWLDYRKPNVYIGSVSPMDEHGFMRCSLCLIQEKEMMEQADIVILEVNPNMPVVNGETEIHISEADYIVEVNTKVPILPKGNLEEIDKIIGQYISTLVNDGDTIQLGIGSIPDASALALMNKKDLGVHTEMITNSVVDLVDAGVITNRKKSLHKGKIVGTFALGDEKLYKMLNNNPSVMMMRGSYVNNPFVVAKNDNMVSINTGVSVDLTGQVNSESIGSLHYSGSGGQNDTAEGAIHAKNGRSIIALKSTAKNGTVSTIMPVLAPGAIVTLSRNNVDYIVTEFGIAPMRGRSVRERINNLIGIAHPDFRDELRRDAEKYLLW